MRRGPVITPPSYPHAAAGSMRGARVVRRASKGDDSIAGDVPRAVVVDDRDLGVLAVELLDVPEVRDERLVVEDPGRGSLGLPVDAELDARRAAVRLAAHPEREVRLLDHEARRDEAALRRVLE